MEYPILITECNTVWIGTPHALTFNACSEYQS